MTGHRATPGDAAMLWINPGEIDIPVPESWMEEAERLLGAGGRGIEGISSREAGGAGKAGETGNTGAAAGPIEVLRARESGVLRPQEIVVLRAVKDRV